MASAGGEPRVQAVPVAQPAYPAAAASPYGIPPPKHPTAAYNTGATRDVKKLSLVTSLLRVLQVIFAMIGFAIMASAKADSELFSYNWDTVKAYKFCLSMLIIVFVWALLLAILELLEAFAKLAVGGGVKPYIVALGDLILAFLLFGAACAAATVDTDFLSGTPSKFSSMVRAATAFAFLTWFVLVPTMVINLALVASEFFSS